MLIGLLILCIVAFLIGSFPTGYLIGRLKGIDARKHGSGNVGATNIFRLLGAVPALITLLIDAAKGYFAVTALYTLGVLFLMLDYTPFAFIPENAGRVTLGLCAIAGHVWSIFLCWKGGKGVATSIGIFLGLDPLLAGIALAAFVLATLITRYVSVGSLIGATAIMVGVLALQRPVPLIIFSFVASAFVFLRHRENIKRLRAGKELKIAFPRIETKRSD